MHVQFVLAFDGSSAWMPRMHDSLQPAQASFFMKHRRLVLLQHLVSQQFSPTPEQLELLVSTGVVGDSCGVCCCCHAAGAAAGSALAAANAPSASAAAGAKGGLGGGTPETVPGTDSL